MSLTKFIESNYLNACKMQREIKADNQMKDMLRERNIDSDFVKSWMRSYALFQGIESGDRDIVIEKYASVVFDITDQSNIPDREQVRIMFHDLLSALYGSVPRKWLSATSKLLWCSFPDQIVIYDAFVERALVVLQCIEPSLANSPRIGVSPSIKSESDLGKVVKFYMNYQDMVKTIFSENQEQLTGLRETHREKYPHDIRIVDKLLWMIGNPNQHFH